ncbi:MAG: MFS transporter, partial [Acidimicrobiales bacterium]
GIGMSLLYPSLFTAVMAAAPESERSHAVGTFSVFFDLSNGFGATLIGVAVSLSSYRGGFAVAAAIAGVGLCAQWLLRDRIGARHLAGVPDVAVGTGSAGPSAA